MSIRKPLRTLVGIVALAATAAAQGPRAVKVTFTDVRLENGLRVKTAFQR